MRGFVMSMEALLALYTLVIFITQLFLPTPTTASVIDFASKNDLASVEMERYGVVYSYHPVFDPSECLFIRYYYKNGVVYSVCVK